MTDRVNPETPRSPESSGRAPFGGAVDRRMLRDVRESLRSQPGRAALSFFSVTVGVVVLTLLLAILFGLQRESREMVRRFGANVVALVPDRNLTAERGYRGLAALTDLLRAGVGDRCGVMTRTPVAVQEIPGAGVWAADDRLAPVRGWDVTEGRAFDASDMEQAARVILLSESAARAGGLRPGGECTIDGETFRVIGLVADGSGAPVEDDAGGLSPGGMMGVIPVTTAARIQRSVAVEAAALYLKTGDGETAERLIERCERILRDPAISSWRMQWVTPDSLIRGIRDLQRLITLTAGSVSLLCLILGGTTLMSLMLAEVRQRIPEIGLRRSIGASRLDVAMLFVTESCLITGAAAVAGIAVAGVMLALLSGRVGLPLSLHYFTFVIPVIVSIVLGGVFSYWPARVASGLSPAQALRNA